MQTYLVGRSNTQLPCDIELPAGEMSVSRRHLELSVTDDGRFYVVHLHPQNVTSVWRGGIWRNITQDYVEEDEPLRVGAYETTVRQLLRLVEVPPSSAQQPEQRRSVNAEPQGEMIWDPDRGTFLRPRR